MNVSRFFLATAVALTAVAATGCSSTRQSREVAAAPVVVVVPPEQVMMAEPMPSYTVVEQAEPRPAVIVRAEPPLNMAAAEFTERAPQADRN